MAREKELTAEASRRLLFARLRDAKAPIVATTARDTGIDPQLIDPGFDQVMDLVAEPVPTPEQIAHWRDEGERLARTGAAAERVLDGLLSLNWAIWEVVMQQEEISRAVILDFADRLLRGLDDAVAAISEGYVRVEVEAAAAHSEHRRAVLEDLLSAPRATPRDRARIRLRAQRHGLEVDGGYRLVLIAVPGVSDARIGSLVDRLESQVRVPVPHHRDRPGIRLPVVLDWRGHVLVFARASWTGERRLRAALPKVLGDDTVVIDTGVVEGVEALADALTHADYSATVAAALGRRGWIGDPGSLALETTFLLDRTLVRSAVDRELGPLLSVPRMGEELIETLAVYLGSKQNIREAARRLHLAPRTVAYRLERIEALLGVRLEGEVTLRLGAALLALRVDRETGGLEPEGSEES
ncbi:MAG: helix-turn-helix domain-containing protein [Candidatus Limnocylindrales bacterium]